MPYELYKVFHLFGLFLLLSGLMALIFARWNQSEVKPRLRKFSMIAHGVGLVLMLVSGFGLLARLGLVSGLPLWAYIKIGIWLCMGAAISLAKRYTKAPVSYGLIIALVTLAAWTAIYKPGV